MKKMSERALPHSNRRPVTLGWRDIRMTKSGTRFLAAGIALPLVMACGLYVTSPLAAQTSGSAYRPKFHGDPARSDSEAAALAYVRVVIRAQSQFNKQYGHYATSLAELVHTGTFTKRLVNPDRGDYTVGFKGKKDGFVLTMTPQHLDAEHRSFYAEEDGKIHGDEEKPANADSPVIEQHRFTK